MRRVKVNVLNNEYFVKTDAEEEYIVNLAAYVEENVKEIDPQLSTVALPYPLLLAILKIADDYFRLKREFEEFKNRAEERSRRLVEMLEGTASNEPFSPQVEVMGTSQPKYDWDDPSKY